MSAEEAGTRDITENIEPLLNAGKKTPPVSNQRVLQVTAFLFGAFVIAEIVGALVSSCYCG